MGNGWQNQFNNNVNRPGPDREGSAHVQLQLQIETVVKRRKNRSSCEEDIGSLLLCNPSPNLRSLVPKEVMDITHPQIADDNNGKLFF